MSTQIQVSLHHEKETKNTHRFAADTDDAPVSTVYVNKSAFAGAAPEQITLTVEAG